jgi:hypothetical protein
VELNDFTAINEFNDLIELAEEPGEEEPAE